eukprot:CAMPEP_0115157778 /NCGR_PEP_ID=MMETSP0227-20121206/69216_1 /TAXON_ID=89957 /ORGANISM="Polarella glacialis, Strain CCMP 1383" /LENGTH=39 /DNA_ID= /DNA_START= /DNA_END= /DNA_ORIENTATION=
MLLPHLLNFEEHQQRGAPGDHDALAGAAQDAARDAAQAE